MPPQIGIIISISIITALGVAVLENPQIQAWLEQQRQRLVELLRQLGEELDPQSRRAAEAFAFEGRTPATHPGLRREASGSLEAAAVATGRSLSNPSTVRRIPVRGPSDPDEAEERRRKGREYLAQRNQQMYEMRERRKAAKADGSTTPPTPTSFDAMVDEEGKLKESDVWKGKEKELPSFPSLDDVPEDIKSDMRGVERSLAQPLMLGEASSSASAWQLGSQLANPFGDEYALDRSETPKPPVPPKVAIEVEDEHPILAMPGSFAERHSEPQLQETDEGREELSYEEQLAIALSLSEAEAKKVATAAVQEVEADEDDADLRAAIEASLKDMRNKLARQTKSPPSQQLIDVSQPLIDVTPSAPSAPIYQPAPRGHWEALFDQDYSPTREPLSMVQPMPIAEEEDELYRVTPQLTRARLASHDSQQALASSSFTTPPNKPYDPVHEAATVQVTEQQLQAAMEASFYSATSSAPSPSPARTNTQTMDHEPTPQLIDVSENVPVEDPRTPISRSFSFRTDDESSDSDTFASVSAPASAHASRAQSRARSEISNIEVVDLLEDSDVDMLSEEGDGVATPDSWTEVGSRDGESEMDEDEHPNQRLAAL